MPHPEALSASAIQLYLTCSLKYRFQYFDRLPRLTLSENQAFGTAMHAALNWLHRERKRGRIAPLAEVLQVFEADWYAQTEVEGSLKVEFDSPADAALLVHKGKELLTQYYHLPPSPVRDSELRFSLPLVNPVTGEVLDVPIRGVIDLVQVDDVIVEFKAPQKAPPLNALPDDIQVTTYAYAYEKLFGKLPREIRKVSLVRTKNPRIEPQITGRDAHDFERLFHLGREVVKGVRAGVFLPSRGCWLCNDCEYRQDCDEWTGIEEASDAEAAR
jgi:CRISPR/Cas system-associated exonuclease Cas4 (RecB family)